MEQSTGGEATDWNCNFLSMRHPRETVLIVTERLANPFVNKAFPVSVVFANSA